MVDAQRAGRGHVRPQRLDEHCVTRALHGLRIAGRQSPVLPVRVEIVRRRADARAQGIEVLAGPRIRASAVNRNREVEIEADAAVPGRCVRGRKLRSRLPLQVEEKADAARVLPREAVDFGRCRVAVALRPLLPASHVDVLAPEVLMQRFVHREPAQRFAALAAEVLEAPATAVVARCAIVLPEVPVQQLQHRCLCGGDAIVVDDVARAQARRRCLKASGGDQLARRGAPRILLDRFHIQVKRVQEQPARWAVGTRMVRDRKIQGMQRIHADKRSAEPGPLRARFGQVAEIADAPVTLRAQAIELQDDAPEPRSARRGFRQEAALRRDDKRGLPESTAVACNFDAVVAARNRRQRQTHRAAARAIHLAFLGHPQFVDVCAARPRGAVFLGDPPVDDRRTDFRREFQRESLRQRRSAQHHRVGNRPRPLAQDPLLERVPGPARLVEGHAHCSQQCAHGVGAGFAPDTPDIVIARLDAAEIGEFAQGVVNHAPRPGSRPRPTPASRGLARRQPSNE